ncbi:MAG: zinc ribbon domain-containing protein [Eubacteriaceae bacterium]
MKNIDKLWELQQLEDRIIEIEKDEGITDLKIQIDNHKNTYNKLLSMTKQIAQEYKEREVSSQKLKQEINQLESKIIKAEDKLYNENIKKAKVLNQLKREIDDHNKNKTEKNETIQNYKNENLSSIKLIKKYKAKSELIKEEINKRNNELDTKIKFSESKLQEINNSIEKLKKTMLEEDIKYYYDKKEKIYPVVVCYKEDVCDGCKMQFSIIFSQNLKKNEDKIFACENCGRLIYVPKLQEA